MAWYSGKIIDCINKFTLHQVRLVLRYVTICEYTIFLYFLDSPKPTQPNHHFMVGVVNTGN